MLEIAAFPADLNIANPTQSDPATQGWQHINLVKGVIQNTLPNINAQITAVPADLNNVLLTTRGINTGKTLPIYNSATVASTVPVTDFGLSLLTVNDLADLNSKFDKSGYVSKSGDTMTGALTAPRLNLGTNFGLYVDGNGAPTIQLAPGCAITFDPAQNAVYITLGGKIAHIFRANGTFEAKGNVIAGSTS